MKRAFLGVVLLLMGISMTSLGGVRLGETQEQNYLSLRSQALTEIDAGNYSAAEQSFKQAIDLARSAGENWNLAVLLSDLADMYRVLRRIPASQQAYEDALGVLDTVPKTEIARAFESRAL